MYGNIFLLHIVVNWWILVRKWHVTKLGVLPKPCALTISNLERTRVKELIFYPHESFLEWRICRLSLHLWQGLMIFRYLLCRNSCHTPSSFMSLKPVTEWTLVFKLWNFYTLTTLVFRSTDYLHLVSLYLLLCSSLCQNIFDLYKSEHFVPHWVF
jgi:hypothetical protein